MADPHPDTRLEAFCDGVFAIALTLLIVAIAIVTTMLWTYWLTYSLRTE